jgi:hypothetical protein
VNDSRPRHSVLSRQNSPVVVTSANDSDFPKGASSPVGNTEAAAANTGLAVVAAVVNTVVGVAAANLAEVGTSTEVVNPQVGDIRVEVVVNTPRHHVVHFAQQKVAAVKVATVPHRKGEPVATAAAKPVVLAMRVVPALVVVATGEAATEREASGSATAQTERINDRSLITNEASASIAAKKEKPRKGKNDWLATISSRSSRTPASHRS